VCLHPEKARIEALNVAGVSIDKLAEQFNIHRDAAWRHCKRHMSAEARASYLLGPAKIGALANQAADESRSIIDYLVITRSILMNQLAQEVELNKSYAVERIAGRLIETLRSRARGELGHATGEVRRRRRTRKQNSSRRASKIRAAHI
jgi:hypothetical protein